MKSEGLFTERYVLGAVPTEFYPVFEDE